jgi:LPXTG-motif cell wall-anchored protein
VISVYYVKNSTDINPGQTPTGSGTTITGNQTPAASNPNTGDNSSTLPIAAALSGFAVIAGLSFLSIARKRKKA